MLFETTVFVVVLCDCDGDAACRDLGLGLKASTIHYVLLHFPQTAHHGHHRRKLPSFYHHSSLFERIIIMEVDFNGPDVF